MTLHHDVKRILKNQETIMADYSKLNAKLDELKALIVAGQGAPAPVIPDEQPSVDAAAAEVDSIIALVKPA